MPSFGNYQVFDEIYQKGYWGQGSGGGSSPTACKPHMGYLKNFFKKKKIKSVTDLGCGDWQFSQYLNLSDVCYTGVDASKNIIFRNQQSFGTRNIHFIHFDGDYSVIPDSDLLLCKDVLQHLSINEIWRFINSILPRFRYALITNDIPKRSALGRLVDRIRLRGYSTYGLNQEILIGDYRPLDISQKPFSIPCKVVLEWRVNPYRPNRLLQHPKASLTGDNCEWKKRTVLIGESRNIA